MDRSTEIRVPCWQDPRELAQELTVKAGARVGGVARVETGESGSHHRLRRPPLQKDPEAAGGPLDGDVFDRAIIDV